MRSLVEAMRDYIQHGRQIPVFWLGFQRQSDKSNIWGYEDEAMSAVRMEGSALPIIHGKPEEVFD